MRPNPQETADLVTFTAEIPNGKLHFLFSAKHDMNVHLYFACIFLNSNINILVQRTSNKFILMTHLYDYYKFPCRCTSNSFIY